MSLFNNNRVTRIEDKFQFYENLSKEMTLEIKRGLERLSTVNESIVLLLNKHDVRMTVLETRDDNHDNNFILLKNLVEKFEQSHKEHMDKVSNQFSIFEQKLIKIDKLIYTGLFVLSSIITISGLLASSGWLSPDRFIPNTKTRSAIFVDKFD